MSKDIVIPDYLKDMMAEGTVVNTTQDMEVATGGVPRISTKGKVFRFKEGEDETKEGQEINVIIIGLSPERGLAHTFYIDGYSPDSNDPPDCSSMDGVNPDHWINEPQHENCIKCPNQIWGSAKSMSGGKAKACKDSKHIYVAKAKDFSADADNCKLWLMTITVNSLKAFTNYGKLLASKGIPGPQFAVTKIYFDEDASVPKLEFDLMGMLGEKHGPTAHKRSQAKEWDSGGLALENKSKGESKRALPKVDEEDDDIPFEKESASDDKDVDSLLNDW